jgi:hypothetical protein
VKRIVLVVTLALFGSVYSVKQEESTEAVSYPEEHHIEDEALALFLDSEREDHSP